jgi:hypothetical protein
MFTRSSRNSAVVSEPCRATTANKAAEIDMVPMVSNGMPLPEGVEHLEGGDALFLVGQHPRLFVSLGQSGHHGLNLPSYRSSEIP